MSPPNNFFVCSASAALTVSTSFPNFSYHRVVQMYSLTEWCSNES